MSDTVRTWRHIQQRYNLIGSKCKTCGELFFPARVVCPNCRRKGELEPFQFSGKGKIYTYSIIRSAPDDFKKAAPYAVAVIELEEGAKLTSQLVDCDVESLEIGDDVEMVFRKIREDGKDGVISYGYNSKLSNNSAVILVSHGSTLPYAEKVFEEIKEKFIKKTGIVTEIGYMKVSEPTIAGAVEILKGKVDDLDKIIAIPVFLAPGIHTNIDIPQLLGLDALEQDPRCPDGNYPDNHYLSIADDVVFDGEIKLLDSIGPRDELLDIIDKRINEALSESKLDNNVKTGILLVTHGSRLNYNKEFATELYNKFEKTCDLPSSFGFMELCGPSIPESIDKLVSENDLERLVVIPVFIAPGMHTTHDIPHILGFLDDHEHSHSHSHDHGHDHSHDLTPVDFDGEILYPEPIKADDILIDILIDMVNEAS